MPRDRWSRLDVTLGTAVSIVTFIYLVFIWPKILVQLDEGPFLFEAKRILDGEVMYRDFFDLTGPLAQHALALMYAVAGVSMETARGGTALLHGVIVAFMYAIMRRLGARPTLAAVCCLVDLAWFFPEFAMATPHWFSTTFAILVYWYVLRAPLLTPRRALTAGALTALVALTQQPKGVATAVAVGVVLLWDHWGDRQRVTHALPRQLGAYAAGVGIPVLITLLTFVAIAGFGPVVDALIVTPLGPYRNMPFVSKGRWMLLHIDRNLLLHMLSVASPYLLLNTMPLIVPLAAARFLFKRLASNGTPARRPSFVALMFGASAILSVLYLPNHSHFAIVGPLWLPLYGELLERVIQRLERATAARISGPIAVAGLLVLVGLRVRHAIPYAWGAVAATDRSSFGSVDFASVGEVFDIASVRAALQEADATRIFVYPAAAAVYLMTDTVNPTRFQLLMPDYNTAAQFAEVQQVLEQEKVPFVVRSFYLWGNKASPDYRPDLLLPYLSQHYEPVALPRQPGTFPTLTLLRRKTTLTMELPEGKAF